MTQFDNLAICSTNEWNFMRLKELQEKIQNAKRKLRIMNLGPKEKRHLKRKGFSECRLAVYKYLSQRNILRVNTRFVMDC